MVQLNPLKWGSKNKKKKKDNLRIEEIKSSLARNTRTQGGAGIRRKALQNELASLGGKTDAQKAKEDQAARSKYDKDHRIVNKRGRVTGYKEGYDPSKGVQKKTSNKTQTTTTKSKSKGNAAEIAKLKKQIKTGGMSMKRGGRKRQLERRIRELGG
tara:strand:- start:131 stop:598 length:468 start_codon:yes stop_codon:yes gene_type:complete